MTISNPKSEYVHVNGIRLHYLDWSGTGPTMIFLTGMGSSAYIFSRFAPRFTDKFHVLALTRRGQGDSDDPDSGYDADTLTEDIRQFMDSLNVHKAILAGHSLAGVELTHFAATYPTRVEKLVYLDALDDRRGFAAIREQDPLNKIEVKKEASTPRTLEEYIAAMKQDIPEFAEIWSELWDEEIAHGVKVNEQGIFVDRMPATVEKQMIENLVDGYTPKKVEIPIPTLSFFARRNPKLPNAYTEEQKATFYEFHRNVMEPFGRSLISDFQARFPQARIVVIPEGHHYCFIAQEDLVYEEMRRFL